jgi:hypothetical protein
VKLTRARVVLIVMIAVLLLPIGLIFGYSAYKVHPIDSFCSDIPQSATPEEILTLAKTRGFENVARGGDEVMVFNQWGPFWRFACEVKFKDNRQISKEVIDGD